MKIRNIILCSVLCCLLPHCVIAQEQEYWPEYEERYYRLPYQVHPRAVILQSTDCELQDPAFWPEGKTDCFDCSYETTWIFPGVDTDERFRLDRHREVHCAELA